MSHTPHELAEDFADKVDLMERLRASDPHFAKLYADYHEINDAVVRAETDQEPTDDLHLTEMRKQRAHLKDKIAHILNHHEEA